MQHNYINTQNPVYTRGDENTGFDFPEMLWLQHENNNLCVKNILCHWLRRYSVFGGNRLGQEDRLAGADNKASLPGAMTPD